MSVVSSYAQMFDADRKLGIEAIRIPMIQRDYAQGRRNEKTERIRKNFVEAMTMAVLPRGEPIGLDFVYGYLNGRVLSPLDGQQRLTTLFLLHWYLAVRSGGRDASWLNFGYETRASARQFCIEMRRIASSKTEVPLKMPSEWIADQSWFMPGWKTEPTISSMLVVLDALHGVLAEADHVAALGRLTDNDQPAIHFHFLDLSEMDLDDDIYVRMNSRGKPLTDFEIFKARFLTVLEAVSHEKAGEFAQKIDGEWLDIFWNALSGENDTPAQAGEIDAAMLRYMRFLADFVPDPEVGPVSTATNDTDFCLETFGKGASKKRLDWLFEGFDIWKSPTSATWFAQHFHAAGKAASGHESRLPIFDLRDLGIDLFLACCRSYSPDPRQSKFPGRLALLLLAIMTGQRKTDIATMRRLRTVRNLAQWSSNEIRLDTMPRLAEQTRQIMLGSWPERAGYNAAQMEDECRKTKLVETNPHLETSLHSLEDHRLLKGRLVAFDLDLDTLYDRAKAFMRIFGMEMDYDSVAKALLAADDYTYFGYGRRKFAPATKHDGLLQEVLTGTFRYSQNTEVWQGTPVSKALAKILANAIKGDPDPATTLDKTLIQPFLDRRSKAQWFDWRYYFVAYQTMRKSNQGYYHPPKVDEIFRMGYVVRRHNNLQWGVRDADPYLEAVCANLDEDIAGHLRLEQTDKLFTAQWLRIGDTGITLASRYDGWRIYLPENLMEDEATKSVFTEFGLYQKSIDVEPLPGGMTTESLWCFPINQSATVPHGIEPPGAHEVLSVDVEDRIKRACEFLKALLKKRTYSPVLDTD